MILDAVEKCNAQGRFDAELIGPKEEFRSVYCLLRDIKQVLDACRFVPVDDECLSVKIAGDDIRAGFVCSIEREMRSMEEVKWLDSFPNVVTTVGKNLMLDTALAGSSYTVVGPYVGLISAISYTAVAAGDTMSSHGGWLEAGGTNAPTYTAPRKTAAWAAAASGAKALSSALAFPITSTGTVKGAFIVYGTGAVNTIDNTAGTLYSAGLFTGGDKPVANGDTLNVSYSTSL